MIAPAALIEVDGLTIEYRSPRGSVRAVDEVSLSVTPSEVLGLVGESGCGKSSLALALLGHIAASARVVAGDVRLRGESLLGAPPPQLARYRGRRIGFVPQNPATGLSPNRRIGAQLAEVVLHHGVAGSREEAMALARHQFALVGLPDPDRILRRYPHELSGGQQQRVCIAIAVACRPEFLVLDEPTTGLDVTTQARIIDLLRDLRARSGIGMLYVTHDLGLLAQIADRVGVMYAGRLVEIATVERLFAAPHHPYSRALIASAPSLDRGTLRAARLRGLLRRDELPPGCPFFPRCDHAEPICAQRVQRLDRVAPDHEVACQRWPLLPAAAVGDASISAAARIGRTKGSELVELKSVSLAYGATNRWRRLIGRNTKPVVTDLSLSIAPAEIFALVGESGSGKSTIARAMSGLLNPRSGRMQFRGEPLDGRLTLRPLDVKRQIQYVFQNPDASLNPRERIGVILARPLRLYFPLGRSETRRRAADGLQEVRLDPSYAGRYPDQLSGGERQRVAIARALVAQPTLILCDEVLSALDVSVQASVIDLLARLRQETGVAMLFISHDLAVVRHLADRTGVLFGGTLVEYGSTASLFEPPFHPYTEELLMAIPSYRQRIRPSVATAEAKSRRKPGRGCIYAGRCRHHRGRICDEEKPPWRETGAGHAIRCHIPLEELLAEGLISASAKARSGVGTSEIAQWSAS
jgi:peptide/nickel transport system ATP-binding protein